MDFHNITNGLSNIYNNYVMPCVSGVKNFLGRMVSPINISLGSTTPTIEAAKRVDNKAREVNFSLTTTSPKEEAKLLKELEMLAPSAKGQPIVKDEMQEKLEELLNAQQEELTPEQELEMLIAEENKEWEDLDKEMRGK